MAFAFTVNGKAQSVDTDANTPLLWVVREHLKLTGTKFGCGAGLCGACTVHHRRQGGALLPDHHVGGQRKEHHHHRGSVAG